MRSHHLISSKLSLLIKSWTVLLTGLTVGDYRDISVLRFGNKSTEHERTPSLGDFLLCRNSVVRPLNYKIHGNESTAFFKMILLTFFNFLNTVDFSVRNRLFILVIVWKMHIVYALMSNIFWTVVWIATVHTVGTPTGVSCWSGSWPINSGPWGTSTTTDSLPLLSSRKNSSPTLITMVRSLYNTLNKTSKYSPSIIFIYNMKLAIFICLVYGATDFHLTFK